MTVRHTETYHTDFHVFISSILGLCAFRRGCAAAYMLHSILPNPAEDRDSLILLFQDAGAWG